MPLLHEPWKPTWSERLDPKKPDEHNVRERQALADWVTIRRAQTTKPLEFAITGSQTWWDWRIMWSALSCLQAVPGAVMRNGMAKGADNLALSFWRSAGMPLTPFEANWRELGKAAGHVRNRQMITPICDLAVGFLCHAGPSPGTRGALDIAQDIGLPVFVFHQSRG